MIANRYGHYWLDNILKQIIDLSAAIKCPELSTCTKNLIFPSFYTKTVQLWDEIIETEPCRKELFIWYNPGIKINNTSIFWKRFLA